MKVTFLDYRFLYPLYILIYMFKEMMHWYVTGLSCKPNIYVSWSTPELRVRFKPSSKIFLLTIPRRYLVFLSGVMLICESVFDAGWSLAWKGLTSWLACVMSYCDFVTFLLVSWHMCSNWLYRFLIFVLFLTLMFSLLDIGKRNNRSHGRHKI